MDTNTTTTVEPCAYDGCTSGLPGTVEVEVPAEFAPKIDKYTPRRARTALLCPACAEVVRDSISAAVTVREDGVEPRSVAVKGVRLLFPRDAFTRPRKPRAAKPTAPAQAERPAAARAPALTREAWLDTMVAKLRPVFEEAGSPLPGRVRVTCGWPSTGGLSARRRTIGECWPASASEDGTHEIMISPTLAQVVPVLETLVHELAHAALPPGTGHRAPFARLCDRLGMVGKATENKAGEALAATLRAMADTPYPHAKLDMSRRPKQGTRMLKVVCPECGYTIRTTRQWIVRGLPTCPCGTEMEEA